MVDLEGVAEADQLVSPRKKLSLFARTLQYVQRRYGLHRAAKEKLSPSDRAAQSSARATWVIAIVAISQYVIFDRQLKVMQGQLDETRVEQRAWMGTPVINVAEPIRVENGKATITLDVSFKNVGHTPTHGVQIDAVMVALKEGSAEVGDWRTPQDAVCKLPHSLGNDEFAVTPDDTFAYAPHFSDLTLDVGSRKQFFAVVTGCVFYKITADDRIHRTGFVGTVVHKAAGHAIPVINPPVPATDLKVITYAAGYSD